MKHTLWAFLALTLAACTPAEQSYCEGMGVPPGSPEYGRCTGYYFTQTAAFGADSERCAMEADATYPSALYDTWKHERVHGGYGPHGYYSGYTVDIPPNYAHNQLVDSLRMQIIAPCMRRAGWNSPVDWRAGRAQAIGTGVVAPLPWTVRR